MTSATFRSAIRRWSRLRALEQCSDGATYVFYNEVPSVFSHYPTGGICFHRNADGAPVCLIIVRSHRSREPPLVWLSCRQESFDLVRNSRIGKLLRELPGSSSEGRCAAVPGRKSGPLHINRFGGHAQR